MDNPQNQIAQSLSAANNVMVTVSNNPSVDQLAAAIGLSLVLNKMGKHASAVFSGQIPSILEFLEPEKTIERNTDSLRDFIIALDKSKADKLRYKVEDKLVKIFITPYRTSIDQDDLQFSQGDFNVDAVVAIGVKQREQLDQTITAHGRILHDANMIAINLDGGSQIGALNWVNDKASSFCEMVVDLIDLIKNGREMLDSQISTALLTGIVAETQRFSNSRTNANTMNISAQLLGAGANQQLVATKLEAKPVPQSTNNEMDQRNADGTIKVEHPTGQSEPMVEPRYANQQLTNSANLAPTKTSENTTFKSLRDIEQSVNSPHLQEIKQIHAKETLTDIEKSVNSPHLTESAADDVSYIPPGMSDWSAPPPLDLNAPSDVSSFVTETASPPSAPIFDTPPPTAVEPTNLNDPMYEARQAIDQAMNRAAGSPMQPIAALNANPVDIDLGHDDQLKDGPALPQVSVDVATGLPTFDSPGQGAVDQNTNPSPDNPPSDQTPPPSVPPPMMPPNFGVPGPS